jgi:hypothetical protein
MIIKNTIYKLSVDINDIRFEIYFLKAIELILHM